MLLVQNTQGDFYEVTIDLARSHVKSLIMYFELTPKNEDLETEYVSVDLQSRETLPEELERDGYKIITDRNS